MNLHHYMAPIEGECALHMRGVSEAFMYSAKICCNCPGLVSACYSPFAKLHIRHKHQPWSLRPILSAEDSRASESARPRLRAPTEGRPCCWRGARLLARQGEQSCNLYCSGSSDVKLESLQVRKPRGAAKQAAQDRVLETCDLRQLSFAQKGRGFWEQWPMSCGVYFWMQIRYMTG